MFILRILMHLDNKLGFISCYLSLLSTFSYAFPPRAESATFLFATMFVLSSKIFVWGAWNCIENARPILWSFFQNLRLGSIQLHRKCTTDLLLCLPKSSFGEHKVVTKDSKHHRKPTHHMLLLSFVIYAPQTKILESWTNSCVCVFERIFNDRSPSRVLTP